jgi:hypothetical protein
MLSGFVTSSVTAEPVRSGQNGFARGAHGGDHVPALRVKVACSLEAIARRGSSSQYSFHGVEQILSSHSAVEGTMELPDVIAISRELEGPRRKRASGY